MFVYSKAIIRFSEEIKKAIRTILEQELHLKCLGTRFYDRKQRFSYPIQVVIYNHQSMLGYFQPDFYELGFHEKLMHSKKEDLYNIIRHELAHYLVFITQGHIEEPHGAAFKAFCQQAGWGPEVFQATITLDEKHFIQEENSILRKIKKLMALASSQHLHESEQATIKSQQLLLKHNLEEASLFDEEQICMQRVLTQTRLSIKMRAISTILRTFLVDVVIHKGKACSCLEVIGKRVNVEIAEYVATVLDAELEHLWDQAKKRTALQGITAKNSFFLGVAKGYCDKIQALKQQYSAEISRGLIVLEKKLTEARDMVYPRLSSTSSSARYCASSAKLGEKAGKHLNINPAIKKQSNGKLLT